MSSTGALPGFRDFFPAEFAERAWLFDRWRDVARRFGFLEYDGPPLEPLDLYTKKSGDEIVGQLYSFEDKGGRDVSLRPEMTPTVARMVAARASSLRKPVRWFSIPQLFRYERQQRGRLREHFQLNVDIFGESDVAADAELLAVACEIMRACGLGPEDVRARVSDRRLLGAVIRAAGIPVELEGTVFGVIDKIEREPRSVLEERMVAAGVNGAAAGRVLEIVALSNAEMLLAEFDGNADVMDAMARFERYRELLSAHGVAEYLKFDLSIVRGLAYYTGMVFELFDARGEFRAICGGGRYDNLLAALGGVDMPALGFGMGDVVLGELLRARGRMPKGEPCLDYWVAPTGDVDARMVVAAATALRRSGASVEYPLRQQALSKQMKAASSAGAKYVVFVGSDFSSQRDVEVKALAAGTQETVGFDILLARVREHHSGASDRP
jgi:histidyl-tRNA synthetase